jgi:hypothetical protein
MTKIYNKTSVIITDDKGNERVQTKEQLQISLDKMKLLQTNIEHNIANIEYDIAEIAKV